MRKLVFILLGLLVLLPAIPRDNYLELRANARLYEEPDRESEVVAQLKPKSSGGPLLLKLLSEERKNNYYNVETPDGSSGWIYKSYVKGYGSAPSKAREADEAAGKKAGASSGKGFQSACELPFPVKAERLDIDKTCGPEGSGKDGKALSAGNRLQNRAKNNLCATGKPVDMAFEDFIRLQKIVDNDLRVEYGHGSKLPEDRSVLRKLKVGNKQIGEGSVVRYAGYVNHPRNSNVSKGESVNCSRGGAANNDIHIDILRDPEENVCSSITVEIIPHYRPKLYSVNYVKELQSRPFRFTGQLFFDGSHKPCKTLTGPGGNPKRASVWEIHPVYSIDVCKFRDLKKCNVSTDSAWIPMQDSINEVFEDDD